MNVRIVKRAARILATVLVLSIILSVSAVSASAYEVKGRTLAQALGMDGAVYYGWLRSHINDTYYNTTPYEHADHRNPNGDCEGANGTLDTPGVPALNCMGFVWHALYMPTKMSGGRTGLIPSYGNGGWYGLYTGYNLSRRYFNSKRDLLKSGYAEPGDIIWMFEVNETVADDSNHIAIYMGDGHSDRVWHAVKAGTKFGYINPDYAEYLVIKSGAVRTFLCNSGYISLNITQEHRHSDPGKCLCHDLHGNCLACSGCSCDKPVPVCMSQIQVYFFTFIVNPYINAFLCHKRIPFSAYKILNLVIILT